MNNQDVLKQVEDVLKDEEKLKQFYKIRTNNYQLSYLQCLSAFIKRPNITVIKTYDDWNQNNGRRITPGSRCIWLSSESSSEKKYVFDLSQTYGKAYRTKEAELSIENLIKHIKNQVLWKQAASSKSDELYLNVEQFCKESGYVESNELKQIAQAVIFCVIHKLGNSNIDFSSSSTGLSGINITTLESACDLSQALIVKIIEERRIESVKRERTTNARVGSNSDNRAIDENDISRAANGKTEQIRFDDLIVSQGAAPSAVYGTILDERAVQDLSTSENRSGSLVGNLDRTNEETNATQGEFDVSRNSPVRTTDLQSSRQASEGTSSVSSEIKNYCLTNEDVLPIGAKTRFRANVEAIKTVYTLDNEKRQATLEEQRILAKYVGWGGIPQVFDPLNKDWQKEYLELKELVSVDEYRNAKSSVNTAHYTSQDIIKGIYQGLEHIGFKDGTILEPALGIGNFIGLMPESVKSKVYGVEIDKVTGRIASYLYPNIEVQIKGFEKTDFPNEYFDSVITNVPFGDYKVSDSEYDSHNWLIHDYFIAKSINKVRPGGVMAVITSKGTLDKSSSSLREYVAERAELLGAMRLPNNAFKANAGTEVTTDILFFQKRDIPIVNPKDDWIYTGRNEEGLILNEYYVKNPQMLLGKMVEQPSIYGGSPDTLLIPDERSISEAIQSAIYNLPEAVYSAQQNSKLHIENYNLPADLSVRNFCYALKDEKIYLRSNNEMLLENIIVTAIPRIKGMIELRQQVRYMLDIQLGGCTDEKLVLEQKKLSSLYDLFTKKYGDLHSRINKRLFYKDADFPLLLALENVKETTDGTTITKTDIFSKRTISARIEITTAKDVDDGLKMSKNEYGKVNIQYIAKLTNKSSDDVIEELGNAIYKNPDFEYLDDKYAGWETAVEYLSGNVKEKLNKARYYAESKPEYKKNVEALVLAQPKPLTATEISVRLGSNWVAPEYYRQFAIETFKLSDYRKESLTVDYNYIDGKWNVDNNRWGYSAEVNQIYGTSRMDAYRIFEYALNLQTPTVYDTVKEDGKDKRIVNKSETIAVREKQRKLQELFKNWVFDNAERREKLTQKYNDTFNNIKLAQYDGSYLTFPEINPAVKLFNHQKDAIERIIISGNTLLHHVVGAGKTYEMIGATMKLRQMGIAKKPMLVVPNHLVLQTAEEFKKMYPNANLLIATKKDLEKTNRLNFVSRVATGDWDGVIIAMSSFEKIPISQERQQNKITSEIDMISEAISDLRQEEGSRITVKQLELTLKNKQAQLEKLMDSNKKDNLLNFEALGVDYLFIDEAHNYKNKFIFTKINNVAGISKANSKRASDLDLKCEYINEKHNGNIGVVFATGTPISNSMVEMYTMQSYLQRDKLKENGLQFFDNWAATFGETQTTLELAPSGQGYRSRTRFAKFTNMPELLKMYRSFADVKTADMLTLDTPTPKKITITCKPTNQILLYNEEITFRAERIANGMVNPEIDNMLKITSDGKKLALDPRCFDREALDDSEHKLNVAINNIFEIWQRTTSTNRTQVVFCDLSVPSIDFENYNPEKNFDVYNDIKFKLVNMGIPKEHIAFAHEANTDIQKQSMFDKVNSGSIRILIGSTAKCGAGTNIQEKLIALHHLDTPYRPSDLEQREGRIIRQGNTNKEVEIYTYVTERTFDSYSYQILENKQKFISQINKGELNVRTAEDIDETALSYAEIKAITAANPAIKRKMELDNELGRLRTLEGQYRSTRYQIEDKINKTIPEEINRRIRYGDNLIADIDTRNKQVNDVFSIEINGKVYNDKKEAGEIFIGACSVKNNIDKIIAHYKGFAIYLNSPNTFYQQPQQSVCLVGAGKYNVDLTLTGVGTFARFDKELDEFEERVKANKDTIIQLKQDKESLAIEALKPFEYEEEIKKYTEELTKIDIELDLDKKEQDVVIDDEKFKDEVVKDLDEELDESEEDDLEKGADTQTQPSKLKAEEIKKNNQLLELEPIRIYKESDKAVLIYNDKKEPIWLMKNDVEQKNGFVIKATEKSCLSNSLLCFKKSIAVSKKL